MVVDTANDDAEDTETLTLEECGPTECATDGITDSISKSHWYAIPVVFRIETIGIEALKVLHLSPLRAMRTEIVPYLNPY